MAEEKIDYSTFLYLPMTSFNNGICSADGFVLVHEPRRDGILFIEESSLLFVHYHDEVIYVDNKGVKSLNLEGNTLGGLSDNALVIQNNAQLTTSNGILIFKGLPEASEDCKNEHNDTKEFIKKMMKDDAVSNMHRLFKPAKSFKNQDEIKEHLEKPIIKGPMYDD